MLLNLLEYHWAEHIDDALMLLSRLDVKTVPLAGGTYLLGLRDDTIQAVVDLRDLELSYISEDASLIPTGNAASAATFVQPVGEAPGLHIGSMTTLQTMVDSPVLKEFATGLLSRAAQASSSSRLIRNSATIGGTLGAGVASQSDLLTALAVLDAEVVVRYGSRTQINLGAGSIERPGLALSGVTYKGKQERRIPYSSLTLDRRPSELMIEVIIPPLGPGTGASFMRIGRTPTDVALLNVAALVQVVDGTYKKIRLALGGVNMEPIRLYAVERQLEGNKAEASTQGVIYHARTYDVVRAGMVDFRPPSDFRASGEYRRMSGLNLAYRALEEASRGVIYHALGWGGVGRGMVSSEGEV